MSKPLCIDLFCGLGGWSQAFLDAGYRCIGFDIERHRYPARATPDIGASKALSGKNANGKTVMNFSSETLLRHSPLTGDMMEYPGHLVLQDVLTLHGRQFRDAAIIVASPPCQAYSYRAMPWKRTKALPPPSNELFDACFRIQREACEAAGRYIPLVVENVCVAQRWVGRAACHYGSFYLWGDVPALMPTARALKVAGFRFDGSGRSFQSASVKEKGFAKDWRESPNGMPMMSSKSPARKAASAMIAKIPYALARWIADVYKPEKAAAA